MDAVAIVLALVVFALMLGLYGRWIGYERCGRFRVGGVADCVWLSGVCADARGAAVDDWAGLVADPVLGPVERGFYRAVRTDPDREQDWKQYATTVLVFSALFWLALYAILRLQGVLPFNPLRF